MKSLILRSYSAVQKRGLITAETTSIDFFEKIKEEYGEFMEAYFFEKKERETKELIDLINAGIMYLKHDGYDFIKEYEKCVIHQETRKD